jgi:hypothetical protein
MKIEVYQLLKHPVFLLLMTALVSSYLIPKITKRWQDHQKEMELKTSFVSEISESVVSMVTAVQFAELRALSQTPDKYDDVYRSWEIKRAVISSKIRGYFPNTTIGSDWDTFSDTVTDVYALSGIKDPSFRKERITRIRDQFPNSKVDWDTLLQIELKDGGFQSFNKFLRPWFDLREQLFIEKDRLIQRIIDAPVELYRSENRIFRNIKDWFKGS